MVGVVPNASISFWNSSTTPLKLRSVRRTIDFAMGSSERMMSRASSDSGRLTPPGTVHAGCTRSPAIRSMACWPNLRSAMPSLATSGCFSRMPTMLRWAGSESMPSSRSGAERWKKLMACDCRICAQWSNSRSLRAVSGMRTAMIASQAFTAASRWLTGQMPQMRAVIAGIS